MRFNAAITSWSIRAGTSGAGEPMFAPVALRHAISVELVDPSMRRVGDARSEGVQLEHAVLVPAAALAVAKIAPKVGDRVRLRRVRPFVHETDLDVVFTQWIEGGRVVEISLGERRDGQ
ncbi:MAG: hypothetical protein KDA05_10065 [Phycisphaerales bacterium]|nr:hypothetical protein [Phycisphaerales bacterium]